MSHLKLSDVSKKLDELEAKKRRDAASRGGENRRGAGGGGGGGSRGGGGGHRKKIRLLMREVETHAWPPNWRNEVCLQIGNIRGSLLISVVGACVHTCASGVYLLSLRITRRGRRQVIC